MFAQKQYCITGKVVDHDKKAFEAHNRFNDMQFISTRKLQDTLAVHPWPGGGVVSTTWQFNQMVSVTAHFQTAHTSTVTVAFELIYFCRRI